MKATRQTSGNHSGIVLVLALWVIVILSALALNFALNARTGSIITRNFKESVIARTMAVSAIENTVAYILADPDLDLDYVDEDGFFRMDRDREPASSIINAGGITLEISLSDEDSKLNINRLGLKSLENTLKPYAKNQDEAREMVAALLDWRDRDDLHRPGGGEDETYLPLGYESKDAALDVPGELVFIKGFNKEAVHGGEGAVGLANTITTFTSAYNINTAPGEVLEALGIDPVQLSSILDMREKLNGLRNVPPDLNNSGATFSTVFRIEASVSFRGSPGVYRVVSIVKREAGKDGKQQLRTIYWRETIETGRA